MRKKGFKIIKEMRKNISQGIESQAQYVGKKLDDLSVGIKDQAQQTKEQAEQVLEDLENQADAMGKEVGRHCQDLKDVAWQVGDTLSEGAREGARRVNKTTAKIVGGWSPVALTFLGQKDLLRYLGELTQSAVTKYDKALDLTYLQTHIGGSYHRLFDGGHDLISAWSRVREAAGDDTFTQQVVGYTSALWKDVTTVQGLPFATVDKSSFDTWVSRLDGIPGVNREYLADLISYDAMEIVGAALSVVGVFFALRDEDQKQLSSLLGSMGITTIASANPLMGICVVATSAYAYRKKKMELDKLEMAKSSVITVMSLAMFSILGLPVLVNLVVVCVVTQVVRKKVLDNDEVQAIVSAYIGEIGSEIGKISMKDFIPSETIADTRVFCSEVVQRMRRICESRKEAAEGCKDRPSEERTVA